MIPMKYMDLEDMLQELRRSAASPTLQDYDKDDGKEWWCCFVYTNTGFVEAYGSTPTIAARRTLQAVRAKIRKAKKIEEARQREAGLVIKKKHKGKANKKRK